MYIVAAQACVLAYPGSLEVCWEIYCGCVTGDTPTMAPTLERCNNGAQDVDETDVDCGGCCCPRCAVDEQCAVDDDCELELCDPFTGVCLAPTPSPTLPPTPRSCADGLMNHEETGVDCGGEQCRGCFGGGGCLEDSDCFHENCALPADPGESCYVIATSSRQITDTSSSARTQAPRVWC